MLLEPSWVRVFRSRVDKGIHLPSPHSNTLKTFLEFKEVCWTEFKNKKLNNSPSTPKIWNSMDPKVITRDSLKLRAKKA
jgi:hypothetical protein